MSFATLAARRALSACASGIDQLIGRGCELVISLAIVLADYNPMSCAPIFKKLKQMDGGYFKHAADDPVGSARRP